MKTTEFIDFARLFHKERYDAQEVAWRTLYNNLSRLRSFESYCKKGRLEMQEVDACLFQNYKLWCMCNGNVSSTINQKLIPLLQCIKRAQELGIMDKRDLRKVHLLTPRPKHYGEQAQRMSHAATDKVRYLNDDQMWALVDFYQKTRRNNLKQALELFLFSFHACGLRVSDIVTLEWAHIDFDRSFLSKVLVKTKAPLTIPLSAQALDVLGRWRTLGKNGRFVFDLLPEEFDLTDDIALSKAIDYRNRVLRHSLNMVGRILGLTFPLGMHVARHSFAVKALNSSNVSVHLISHLLGHTSVLVTEKVYATFLLPTLSEELRGRLSFPEYSVKDSK